MLWGIEMCELIDNPVSIREKKTKLLQAIFNEMQSSNITAIPTHLDQTYLTVQDSQYKDRPIQISMDNLNLVKVVIIYHQYQYDNTLDDRRNAIKTARDIFDFYHDMQTGSYDKVSESLHGKVLPKLSLYYQNSPSINSVIVTATMRYNYSEFLFCADSLLTELTSRLDTFTAFIAEDNQGSGKYKRWEKEVAISRNWWSH